MVACIGFWSSLVFYNSYLPEIAAPEDRDKVSAKGFAMGYIGSVILQLICFVFVFKPEWFGMQGDATMPARFSFLLVGAWWFGFAQITLNVMPKGTPCGISSRKKYFCQWVYRTEKSFHSIENFAGFKKVFAGFFLLQYGCTNDYAGGYSYSGANN